MDAARHPQDNDATSAAELERLVGAITSLEGIVADWELNQQLTVNAMKRAIEDLHGEALRRLIRALKDEPVAALRMREAVQDRVVYGVLLHHGIVRRPLEERIHMALEAVRPTLQSHGGDVELVAIKLPDTVELRLVGACHGCPASSQTMTQGIETALRTHAPEIEHVKQVSRPASAVSACNEQVVHFVSPFATHARDGWVDAAAFGELADGAMICCEVEGRSLLISRQQQEVSCVENACAHLGMPLADGEVSDGIVTCPYHGFRYVLATGECLTVPEVQLKVHAARVVGDRVQVRLER